MASACECLSVWALECCGNYGWFFLSSPLVLLAVCEGQGLLDVGFLLGKTGLFGCVKAWEFWVVLVREDLGILGCLGWWKLGCSVGGSLGILLFSSFSSLVYCWLFVRVKSCWKSWSWSWAQSGGDGGLLGGARKLLV